MKAFDTGTLTENGKPDYVICPSTAGDLLAVCYAEKRGKPVSPNAPLVRINGHSYLKDPIAVPCGHCVGCRMERAKQWKIRLCHEREAYGLDEVYFVTITYHDSCLPSHYGQPCLCKDDVRKFINNLRHPSYGVYRRVRYFACGEYGDGTKRPHYHLILFMKLDDLVPFAFDRYHSKTIADAWPYGIHELSPVHTNMIAYVAGYVEKKQDDPFWNDYPVKPFLLMSTKPAIGSAYVSRLKGSLDRKVYGDFGNVHSASIPRAYLKKCEDAPWFPAFKERSRQLARDSLALNLMAGKTSNQERLGDLQEDAALKKLEKVRKTQL